MIRVLFEVNGEEQEIVFLECVDTELAQEILAFGGVKDYVMELEEECTE